MWKGNLSRRGLGAFALTAAVVLSGCEDDPVDDDHDHEPEVGGFILMSDAADLYTYEEATASDPDTLHLASGTAYPITIQWLDDDGHETTLEDGLSVEVEFGAAGVATFAATSDLAGTLTAASVAAPAATTMRVRLFHEEEGHHDFTSVFFTVQVSP